MIPFKRRRKTDPDTKRGVTKALQDAFDADDQAENDALQRLIDQMRNFEGSAADPDEPRST